MRKETQVGQGFWERGQRARSCACSRYHSNRGPDVAILRCDSSQAFWPESLSTLWHRVRRRLWVFFFSEGRREEFLKAFIGTQQKEGLRLPLCLAETEGGVL